MLALGAPARLASLAQALAIVLAAAAVYAGFRRPRPGALPLAVLLTATLLAAPHASASDAVLLALATSLYLTAPRPSPLAGGQVALAAAVWIIPLFNPPSVFKPGIITPVLLVLLVAAMLSEIRGRRAPGDAPAPA